jgi:hypothetical protein
LKSGWRDTRIWATTKRYQSDPANDAAPKFGPVNARDPTASRPPPPRHGTQVKCHSPQPILRILIHNTSSTMRAAPVPVELLGALLLLVPSALGESKPLTPASIRGLNPSCESSPVQSNEHIVVSRQVAPASQPPLTRLSIRPLRAQSRHQLHLPRRVTFPPMVSGER